LVRRAVVVAAVAHMTAGHTALSTFLLAEVLSQLEPGDRRAVVHHVDAGIAHANHVADHLRAAETPPGPTLRQVEVRLLAAICHLELAAGALGLDPLRLPRTRPWWARWAWWRW
jgi:hypothetical protein